MINLKKKANFKFSFNFDEINNLKMPKVYAHVINLSRPKKINMQIYSNLDSCVKNVAEYEVLILILMILLLQLLLILMLINIVKNDIYMEIIIIIKILVIIMVML